MTESEAIERLYNMKNKVDVALMNSKREKGDWLYDDVQGTADALRMAIKALEKQIPKKVITPPCNTCEKQLCDCECKHFNVTYRDDYRCPTCDSNGVYISEYEFRFDYCPNCGQKLNWSDNL